MGVLKVCQICGAEYGAHADYCNVCKRSSLVAVEGPEIERARPERLIADPRTLAMVAVGWLIGMGYLIGQVRPREWSTLLSSWVMLSVITLVFCVVMRNVRMAAVMSTLGLCFFVLYGLIVM